MSALRGIFKVPQMKISERLAAGLIAESKAWEF
jgi:hypothetical protein